VRFDQPVPAHLRKNRPLPKELPRAQSGDGLSLIEGGHVEIRVPGVESHRGQLPCLRVLELALPFEDKVEPVFFLRIDDCTIQRRILEAGLDETRGKFDRSSGEGSFVEQVWQTIVKALTGTCAGQVLNLNIGLLWAHKSLTLNVANVTACYSTLDIFPECRLSRTLFDALVFCPLTRTSLFSSA
jgi:hypothetical protein